MINSDINRLLLRKNTQKQAVFVYLLHLNFLINNLINKKNRI